MANKKLISIAIVALFVMSSFAVFGSLSPQTGTPDQQTAASSNIVTSLGNSMATPGSSVGVTLPHAINKNYTQTPLVKIEPITYSPTYIAVGEPVLFSTGATSGLPPYTYAWSFSGQGMNVSASGQSVFESFSAAGSYKVTATVTDGIGQTSSDNVTVIVYNTLSISVAPSTTSVSTGTPIHFNYKIAGGVAPYTLFYNLGNGVNCSVPHSNKTGSIKATYSLPGNYTALFGVSDAGASVYTVYNINVTESTTVITHIPALLVTASYPSPIDEGSTHTLIVRVTGGTGNNNVTVAWGDHTTSTGPKGFVDKQTFHIAHTYVRAALYTIDVTVEDSDGAITTTNVPVNVIYVPPTALLGYFNSAGIAQFPANHTLTLNLAHASKGIELAGKILNGAAPYHWVLSNTTAVVSKGTQKTPDVAFNITYYKTDVSGTHYLTLKVTDNDKDVVYTNLTIIVTTTKLSVTLEHSAANYLIGTTVHYTIQIHNITLNGTGKQSVTVTWSNGTSSVVHSKVMSFTGEPGATILLNDSLTFNGTYEATGVYYAYATVNYGTTFNSTPGAPHYYSKYSVAITISVEKPISYSVYVIPVSRALIAGSAALVYINVTGGSGVYDLTDMYSDSPFGEIYLNSTQMITEHITGDLTPYANISLNKAGKAMATSDMYFNFSFYVVYREAKGTQMFIMTGLINSTSSHGFSARFDIDFTVTEPHQLAISLQASSSTTYASYTSFTLWANVSGEELPYNITINFDGLLFYTPTISVNVPAADYTATWHNTTTTDMLVIDYKSPSSPASFKLTGLEYKSVANYSSSSHEIVANVNSTIDGLTYFISTAYDEYAIPYVVVENLQKSSSSVQAPGVVTFDANAIFGEFPNMHNYTYSWYINGKLVKNTTTSAVSLTFSTQGIYSVYAIVTAPNGEKATSATEKVTVSPSTTIIQIMSLRVLATMTNQTSGQTFIMNAGPADWSDNGTIYASLTVPQTNTGNYTLNVTYSYTLDVTEFSTTSAGNSSWKTYSFNAYNTTGHTQTLHVLSPTSQIGDISSILNGIATIEGKMGTLQTSVNNLNASIASVHNNVVELKTKLGYVNTNLTAMKATLTSTSSKLLGSTVYINSTLGSLSGKVTSISNGVATIHTSVGTLITTTNAIKTKVDSQSSAPNNDLIFLIVVIVLIVIALALVTVLYGRVNKLSKASEESNKQPPQNKQ